MAAKETYHVVTTDGDDHELRTLPAAWLLLTELNVAGRIDRVATEGMNEPGRVTVASRTPEDGWTLHPGAQVPATSAAEPDEEPPAKNSASEPRSNALSRAPGRMPDTPSR